MSHELSLKLDRTIYRDEIPTDRGLIKVSLEIWEAREKTTAFVSGWIHDYRDGKSGEQGCHDIGHHDTREAGERALTAKLAEVLAQPATVGGEQLEACRAEETAHV